MFGFTKRPLWGFVFDLFWWFLKQIPGKVNEWTACFQEEIFLKESKPIRITFNDSVGESLMVKPDGRPLTPLYIYEMTHSNGLEINLVAEELTAEDWAKFTCIRQSADLTEWLPPKGLQVSGTAGRNGAKVQMRTRLGSSGCKKVPQDHSTKQEQQKTHYRLLPGGTVDIFKKKMQEVFGPEFGDFEVKRDLALRTSGVLVLCFL